ncbi:four-carbon acid sugar kinase family protein [Salinarchaeum sp. Harcht-Bsk1]|uniref:four-carbon acid sugar kinase family protein n=1 Tax=Salinarchaeum sp. Harcht-Bsk1 TaxID=1333523 RepID=UPI000677B068|nr:four-carbon acid sugar kinase family protein [Salinarchaeum sp. Harcht-Bsk1]
MSYLVVADDLTGANDTGAAFAATGQETVIEIEGGGDGREDASDAAVRVVNTDSRYSDPATAAERVRSAVERAPDADVYKKVDSTLRGNLVAEIDAAMAASGADLAIVAPAFPATGRITVGGYHLVEETPVAETAAGRDAKGPTTSHVPTLLEASSYPVVHRSLDDLGESVALRASFEELAASGDGALVVADATTDEHLERVADAAAAAREAAGIDVLFVGSGGLAAHVGSGGSSAVLGVVGSVAPETFEQLEAVPDDQVVLLDSELVVTEPAAAVADAAEALGQRLDDDQPAVVTAATDREDVEATLAAGRATGLDDEEIRDHVAEALGKTALTVERDHGIDGLFATGGAVATATFDAFDAMGVRLTGHQVEAGIPLGRIQGGRADGLAVVTKAGAFGGETAIVNGLRFLARYDD